MQDLVIQEPDQLTSMIERMALSKDVDVDKLERILSMQERLVNKKAETDFIQAMATTQREIEPIQRSTVNSHLNSKYVRYEDLEEQIRPIYMKHGFVLTFSTEPMDNEMVRLICDVLHEGGYTKRYHLEGKVDDVGLKGSRNKTAIQGMGSASSYLRRYLTAMIFNVILKNEDNDGGSHIKKISEEQIEYIEALMTETNANRPAFLGTYGISKVEELPSNMFRAATSVLEIKKSKMVV